jgi:TRAP-type transport system periplasmic protein
MPDSITRRRFAALAGGTAITAALPIGYARAAEHTFKIGTNVPASHPLNVHLAKAAEQVKAETGGKSSCSSSPTTSSGPIPTCCRSCAPGRWNAS